MYIYIYIYIYIQYKRSDTGGVRGQMATDSSMSGQRSMFRPIEGRTELGAAAAAVAASAALVAQVYFPPYMCYSATWQGARRAESSEQVMSLPASSPHPDSIVD